MSRSDRKKKMNLKSVNLKKLSKLHIFLIISVVVFVGYLLYSNVISDTTAPVVKCESNEIVVSVTATDKELMKGVSAVDDRNGDVTDSLIIESMSAFADGERVIVYAAVDKSGNVGRCQRILKYDDYEPPVITLTDYLIFPIGSKANLLNYVEAQSNLDGDLTSKIKYSIDRNVDYSVEGIYEVEFRVSDSVGTVSYLTAYLEIYDPF